MAAGQQKRRLNAANLASCNIPEQHGEKRRRDLESSLLTLKLNSHISLEWKENSKRAVATKDQVGISWRHLSPFIDVVHLPRSRTGLSDVFTVPQGIFKLDNLKEILSYEGWETCLSESERKFLSQFLPKGIGVDQTVQSLLKGDNFYFGNPFLEWGSLLCSGNVHPDAIIQKELSFKDDKKAYYSELQKYHDGMLAELQGLKERWMSCKDPTNIQKILSCRRKYPDNTVSSHANESEVHLNFRENFGGTTDSCSSIAVTDEKDDVSDKTCEDSQERPLKPKDGILVCISAKKKVVKNLAKEDRCVTSSFEFHDLDSYEISRTHQQTDKKLKQTGGLVKFKSLNLVLDDTKSHGVRSDGYFEEKEMKLHDHWTQIACSEIMAAHAARIKKQLQINQLKVLLRQEIADNRRLIIDEDEEQESEKSVPEDQEETLDAWEPDSAIQGCKQEEPVLSTGDHKAFEQIPSLSSHLEPDITSEELDDIDTSKEVAVDNHESIRHFTHLTLERSLSLNSCEPKLDYGSQVRGVDNSNEVMVENCEGNFAESSVICMATDPSSKNEPLIAVDLPELMDTKSDESMIQGTAASTGVWSGVSTTDTTYYDGNRCTQNYAVVNKLSSGQGQSIEEQPSSVINLEEDIMREEDDEQILCRASDDVGSAVHTDNGQPLFDAYADEAQSLLVGNPLLVKGEQSYPHHNVDGMKQQELQFLLRSNNLSEGCHYSQHLHEQHQQQMLEHRQAQEKELYALHLMQKNMYDYADKQSTHEFFAAPTSTFDWETDSAHILPFQSSAAGEMLNHHLGSFDRRLHPSCSGLGIPLSSQVHCQGYGSGGEGELFGFLPQWNGLARSPCNTMNSSRYVPPSAYAGGIASDGNGIQYHGQVAQSAYAGQQYDYLNLHDAATSHRTNGGVAWMNMPLVASLTSESVHNSAMHDPIRKPFFGSWNQ